VSQGLFVAVLAFWVRGMGSIRVMTPVCPVGGVPSFYLSGWTPIVSCLAVFFYGLRVFFGGFYRSAPFFLSHMVS